MKNENPLISIALCTYNGEKHIEEQLISILNQSYKNIELIIIDDCSTDKTYAILTKFQQQDSRISLYQNDINIGFNANFWKALSLTTGSFIAIADQDDIWLAHKIDTLLQAIDTDLLIYHDSNYIDGDGNALGKSTQSHHRFVKGYCAVNLVYYNCVSGHTCLMSRELLKITPPHPNEFYYDWWFAYTAACLGQINYLNEKLVNHRIHSQSLTAKDKSNAKKLRLAHLNLFINHPLTPVSLKELLAKLLLLYQELTHQRFSISLFLFLCKNANELFYIRKKSSFSRLKFLIQESTQ